MAAADVPKDNRDALTVFGSDKAANSAVLVNSKNRSGIALVAADNGLEYYFWVNAGVLRFGSKADFEAGTGGAAV